jgi:hypothetical protein
LKIYTPEVSGIVLKFGLIMKKITLLASLLFLFSALPKAVRAQEQQFLSDYNIEITVNEAGTVKVSQEISVTNQTIDYFLKNYVVSLGFEDISNLKVLDQDSMSVPYTLDKKEGGIVINLTANRGVVGVGNKNIFHLEFNSSSLARKQGLMWEVVLPGIAASPHLGSYRVDLSVPQSFGPPTLTPAAASNGRYRFTFTKKDLSGKGLIVNFGAYQLYNFDITYALKNPNLLSAEIPVTLIPKIPNAQEVYFEKMSPKPVGFTQDTDGNQFALFRVNGGKTQDVHVTGRVKVLSNINSVSSPESTPVEGCFGEDEFWPVESDKISTIAEDIDSSQEAYLFAASHVEYKQTFPTDTLVRQGALKALESGEGVCTEFSDLLVTLLRNVGICAQSLAGYGYSKEQGVLPPSDKVVLHSWVRWFDPQKGWQYTDPTWGSTTGLDYFNKFDTNHVVFAIHGQSSTLPYSAGAYVEGSDTLQDKVDISFASEEFSPAGFTTFDELKAASDLRVSAQNTLLKKVVFSAAGLLGLGFLGALVLFLFTHRIPGKH